MSEPAYPGLWHVTWSKDDPPKVRDQSNNLIASVAGANFNLVLARAGLIAATPELYEAVDVALKVFRVMAEYGDQDAALAGQDMILPLQSALDGANFLGRVTSEVLGQG